MALVWAASALSAQAAPPAPAHVRIGVLLPAIGTANNLYATGGWWPRVGWYQALQELNNKTDGVFDHLLPNTTVLFAYRDSKCEPTYALQGFFALSRQVFDGAGTSAVIGCGCSSSSIPAAQVAAAAHVPLLSPTSSSITLSDGKSFPYFMRTMPSDGSRVAFLVDVIANFWNFTQVSLVSASDAYSSSLADVFTTQAELQRVAILRTRQFPPNAVDFSVQLRELREWGSRVILLSCYDTDQVRFVISADEEGIGGDGYMWVFPFAPNLNTAVEDEGERRRLFRGAFSAEYFVNTSTATYRAYRARQLQLKETRGGAAGCDLESDDDGEALLWAQDHDDNASTPLKCAGYDLQSESVNEATAYDAVFAVAHALHQLLVTDGAAAVDGAALLGALNRVRFHGVTGEVAFFDASADVDRRGHGDRDAGLTYELLNFDGSTAGATDYSGMTRVAVWHACASCAFSERFRTVAPLVYSTADNTPPLQRTAPRVSSFSVGVLLPIFRTRGAAYAPVLWSPRVGVLQALLEINNKSDGVADTLLPSTRLAFAFVDSRCDASAGLTGSLALTREAFGGRGVGAIIGAGCSSASESAAVVASGVSIPLLSPSATSYALSDADAYPFFLRTCPSDSAFTTALVDVLLNLFGYTSAALVSSSDTYAVAAAGEFTAAAFAAGLTLAATVSFRHDEADYLSQLRLLSSSSASVLVLLAQSDEGARFIREAFGHGVGGEGYLWMLGEPTMADPSFWPSEATLHAALRGSFALAHRASDDEAYGARRRALLRRVQAEGCAVGRDDEGGAVWASDHDGNASTPLRCAPLSEQQSAFDAYGYDAVFALAHALHELVEVRNRSSIDGAELLRTLLTRVRFAGVSGEVSFGAAAGDRLAGFAYDCLNLAAPAAGFTLVGLWRPCAAAGCAWAERWTPRGVPLVFSTADNLRPAQTASCAYGEIFAEEGQCVCDDGFERNPLNQQCEPCAAGQGSRRAAPNRSGTGGCTVCAEGYFRPSAAAAATECVSCGAVRGASCPFNATLHTLNLSHGVWRQSAATRQTWACKASGAWSPCRGGREGGAYCEEGYGGFRCERCDAPTQYFEEDEALCRECGDAGGRTALLLGVLLGLATLAAAGHALFSRVDHTWSTRFRQGKLSLQRCALVGSTLALMPKLKICIAFYQAVLALPRVYGVRMPASYYDWIHVFSYLDLSVDEFVLPFACIGGGFALRLVAYSLAPLVLMGFALALVALHLLCSRLAAHFSPQISLEERTPLWRALAHRWVGALPALLFISFCLVISTSQKIFSAWHCVEVKVDDTTGETRRYLLGDLSVQCGSAEHHEITVVALLLVVVWPVGFPLLYLILLLKCRDDIYQQRNTRLKRATDFLHFEYTKSLFWWEPFFLVERLAVAGFLKLVHDDLQFIRLLIGLFITIFYMVLLLGLMPYRRQDLNFLSAFGAQFALACIFLGAMILQLFQGVENEVDAQFAQELMGFESTEQVVGMMIVFIFSIVLLFVAATVQQMGMKQSVPVLVFDNTKRPPDLSIKPHCYWHLFLSHIWSSGQDQAANIKRQLQLLLPGVAVFLDVDDLVSIDDLEKYVEQSQCILIFLSKGYFYSTNCMREVEASFAHAKPMSLVHEADLNRGGAPLSVLQGDCPDQRRAVLFKMHDIIPWYRMNDFQVVSLRRISQDLLKATPLYENASDLTLTVPGVITRRRVKFHRNVYLYVSHYNPGAQAFAAELEMEFNGRDSTSNVRRPSQRQTSDGAGMGLCLLDVPDWMRRPMATQRRSLKTSTASLALELLARRGKGLTGAARTRPESAATAAVSARKIIGQKQRTSSLESSPAEGEQPARPPNDSSQRSEPDASTLPGVVQRLRESKKHRPSILSTRSSIHSTSEEKLHPDSLMLLYLNDKTFLGAEGSTLALEIRRARSHDLPIVLVHETVPERGGMEFGKLFQTTPQDLIHDGLYKELAIMLADGEHRKVSYALVAKQLGLLPDRSKALDFRSIGERFRCACRKLRRHADAVVPMRQAASEGRVTSALGGSILATEGVCCRVHENVASA